MKKQLEAAVMALVILTANVMFGAPEDRFKGGINDGYAALLLEYVPADIAISDMVFLPVNATNLSHAGTVSFRVMNNGPDTLNATAIGFDFHMSTNGGALVWIGSYEGTYTLAVGQEQLVILTPQARRGLTVPGDLSGVQQVTVTARHFDPNLANNTTTAAGSVRIKTSGPNSIGRACNDYDGDGKADVAVYSNSRYRWYAALSGVRYSSWLDVETGDAGLTPVPGDYDGDGLTDLAVYNRSSGWWTILLSSTEQIISGWFGGPDFVAVPCDFDGDAITDPMVYREADGCWLGLASSRQYSLCYTHLGETGCQPVVADYDGDGLADPAVYQRVTGLWAISLSGNGYQVVTGMFGGSGYLPASADYDGDGLVDPAIYAPSTAEWQALLSSSLATQGVYTWWEGVAGNINGTPVPADYDGDGRADFAVYNEDTGIWRLFFSAYGYNELSGYFGGPTCQPATE